MSRRHWSWTAVAVLAAGLAIVWLAGGIPAAAQMFTGQGTQGQETTITGRVVDLHGFFTGKYASADKQRCTADCIRAGVPAGIETPEGLVIVGHGTRSAADLLAPLAWEEVQAQGRLYTKAGIRYLDLSAVKKATPKHEDWPEDEEEEEPEDDF